MGGGHPDSLIRERGAGLQKNFFQSFGPQFGFKIRGAQAPRTPPLDPPLEVIGQPQVCTAQ